MSKNEAVYDKRVFEKNISEGILDPKEYQKIIKSLPDLADKADWVSIEALASESYLAAVMKRPLAGEKDQPVEKTK